MNANQNPFRGLFPTNRCGFTLTELLVRFRLFAPDGSEWSDFAASATARDGNAAHSFKLPLNAPGGTWRVEAHEAISGATARQKVELADAGNRQKN